MSAQPNPNENEYLTPEEYLERERKAEFRSEYRGNGIVAPMEGASRMHSEIKGNLVGLLYGQLRGGPCVAYTSDMRVALPGPRYVYPDIVAVCDIREFPDDRRDILTNPTLIIEVLSDSTASYDRGKKWEFYQQIPSLREYVLVAQNRAVVELFTRQGDRWVYSLAAGMGSVVSLESIGASLRLAEIYEDVFLPAVPNTEIEMNTNDGNLNDGLYASFWIGAIATVFGVLALGRENQWSVGLTLLIAYGCGAVVGIIVINCLMLLPPIRRRYEAQPEGMGYGVSYVDLIVPYLIVGLLAALLFVPLVLKHPRFVPAAISLPLPAAPGPV